MALRNVSTMVCSNDFTVCINNDRNLVLSVETSSSGAEDHKEITVFRPNIISSLNHIISISVGGDHFVCLDNDGNVYTFGSNECGQLGIGDKDLDQSLIPQKVNLPPCTQISCGSYFTMCFSESGKVYSFGNNEYGQLGLGNNENYNTPQLISPLKDVEFIECGGYHTFCKTLNGNEIFCWGRNSSGQLGLENYDNQNTPILCSSLLNEDVIDIKCGFNHTLVLTSNGDVLSCGDNEYGQIGKETYEYYSPYKKIAGPNILSSFKKIETIRIGCSASKSFQKIEDLSEITRIECGYNHSLCIDINNDLYIFGCNGNGQLGLGDTGNIDNPMKHPSLSNIIDISKGGCTTFVKISNNEIYAFGRNDDLQLLIKTEHENQITPIRVFEDNEDIWFSNINKSKAKSARF